MSVKVLYASHSYDYPSGWGTSAVNYVLAMNSVGIDVVPRAVKLNNKQPQLPKEYIDLEEKSTEGCDIVIQHLLPHHLKFSGNFKRNIALCAYENEGNWLHNWNAKINMMDELWVPSTFSKRIFENSGITVPIKVVPHAFDLAKYENVEKIRHDELQSNYLFYTIADMNKRKNLIKTIQAFHLAFTPNEPVRLVIKCGKSGVDANTLFEGIKAECTKVKECMKLYRLPELYHSEYLITTELSEAEILQLHATGNAYVNTSHSECFNIPLFEAVAMGKQIVCPGAEINSNNFMYDFIPNHAETFPIYRDACFDCRDTFWEISSSRESWYECNAHDVAKCMRKVYEKRNSFNKKQNSLIAQKYSYQAVGEQIKGMLCQAR